MNRFWSKVAKRGDGDCWLWVASRTNSGYGRFRYQDKMQSAHRFAYRYLVGPIPDGMYVCHCCDNKLCVNPDHLFLGTAVDNVHDMDAKGRRANRKGIAHSMAKLTEVDVLEIRRRVAFGETQATVAKDYRISESSISFIVKRQRWTHI